MTNFSTSTPASRRQALRIAGIGAAAGLLAACGTKDESKAGISGKTPNTTLVPPTVPVPSASEADLDNELTNLRTATSLELVAAATYASYGPKLTDPERVAAAARFAEDHTALAEEFSGAINNEQDRITEPNAWVQENLIDPVASLITNDGAISNLFSEIESMLTATYVAYTPESTTGEWRGRFATIAAASARRSALLGNSGNGAPPALALYTNTDQVSNLARLPLVDPNAEASAEGEEQAED